MMIENATTAVAYAAVALPLGMHRLARAAATNTTVNTTTPAPCASAFSLACGTRLENRVCFAYPHERQWDPRHSARVACQHSHGHEGIKKKEPALHQVNHAVLAYLHAEEVEVELWRADELKVRHGLSSELDQMWSYVTRKSNPRWLWHAIDHHTGQVLAYVFGRRKDDVFLKLQTETAKAP